MDGDDDIPIEIATLVNSTPSLGDRTSLRRLWEKDSVLFLRGVIDGELVGWAEVRFRSALVPEELISPAANRLIWIDNASETRRPCGAIGIEVWHRFVELPLLNDLMRMIFGDEPVWIPIVRHRSSLPTGPIAPDQDIFAARHQDSCFKQGMNYVVCWIPSKTANLNAGSFTVVPGEHRNGNLYDENQKMPRDAIPETAWRLADFRAGDLFVFDFFTPHSTLPNRSDQIRISLDVRAISASSPKPVTGTVKVVGGGDVAIRTGDGDFVTVHVDDETCIRDMHPTRRIPTAEMTRMAFSGAHVMARVNDVGRVAMLRRNFY